MRTRMAWLAVVIALCGGGIAAFSLGRGQETGTESSRGSREAVSTTSVQRPSVSLVNATDRRLTPLQNQMLLSLQGGANWLSRADQVDGHFLFGSSFVPALNTSLEGDNYLHQIAATFALARSYTLTKNEEYLAKARQAVSVLLLDTTTSPQDPLVRFPSFPSLVVNRLAAAGLLVMTINELPAPAEDLLKQSEQLAFIRKCQLPNGSLSFCDNPDDARALADPDSISYYPGVALYGVMLSQRHRPAPWKTGLVRNAMGYYAPWWRAHKNMTLIPWHTAAYAEACLLTHERAFASCVFEMNDWLCDFQHVDLDRNHPFWVGGFMRSIEGKAVPVEPDVGSAAYAESLTQACRVAAEAGDVQRQQRYVRSLESCLQFLTTLQYDQANTQHFAGWYRSRLLGGFHASQHDGSLRVDFTQSSVCALAQYLTYVAKVGRANGGATPHR